ncbi:uncharacterized protein BT62DRAFT_1006564 [Guyanagaster necrorhizus]|uniref:Protein kinase domain-containing protein n=1 Tax=Guyanagaster necrorhizus TaxID=856835 RepID=A0A9P8ARY2_9AGAR|nr:uncharacterized protein BT62DRAFT_1006564 [Guyanagaster necrorhizus MCA 3950]KAG7445565.1 hypothetical protein BT62DRAFT_1006564 [Guyanagaster necrorhizus MCA 3950]
MSGKDLGPPNLGFMKCETCWRQHQPFLDTSGYRLLPKFDPAGSHYRRPIMRCSRAKGGRFILVSVTLRYGCNASPRREAGDAKTKSPKSEFRLEVELSVFLSSPPPSEDSHNHCAPIYDVLQSPHDTDYEILVMPWLRKFLSPSFDTVGELVESFRQILEGVESLHRRSVAHQWDKFRDLYPKRFHPAKPRRNATFTGSAKHITRAECWPRYFFIIDFGMSRRYVPPEIPYDPVLNCGNHYVPECIGSKEGDRCNPFRKYVGGVFPCG